MSQFVTASDGVKIAYDTMGEGPPVLLVHGFGASRAITWKNTNWYQTLTRAGRKIVAIDCRGHGESDKPHEREAYDEGRMAADIVAVLDGLNLSSAAIMGYSMGGFLAIRLMQDWAARVDRAILAGVGENYFQVSPERAQIIAQGLLAPDPATIEDREAREFRIFGERAGNDLQALAACIRRPRRLADEAQLRALPQKILVVCGELDTMTGRPEPLAQVFAHGRALLVKGRNHHSTVGDRAYKDAAVTFFSES